MNRRNFLAVSVAATASGAVTSGVLAETAHPLTNARVPSPSLGKLITSTTQAHSAALIPASHLSLSDAHQSEKLTNPRLTIKPMPDISDRVHTGAGFDIEVLYPHARQSAILYSAHNCTGDSSRVGAYPAGVSIDAPVDHRGQLTLAITQRAQSKSQTKRIKLNATHADTFVLAIPTAPTGAHAAWRLTRVETNELGQPTTLTNALPSTSARCAYLSIAITEHTLNQGENHAS